MPAFRIVYCRGERDSPQAITASFDDLDQALGVFAARGLSILYIAEAGATMRLAERRPIGALAESARRDGARRDGTGREGVAPRSTSFPLRRFSRRVMA